MTRKIVRRRTKKVGAPPGTLQFTGEKSADLVRIRLVDYDKEHLADNLVEDIGSIVGHDKEGAVTWIHIEGLHDIQLIERLGNHLGLHQLVLEDILNTQQRPKVEEYGDDYLYIVLNLPRFDEATEEFHSEQISLILGPHHVVTLQEKPAPVFEEIRRRLESGRRIRFMDADYLAYSIIDIIVDHYFPVLEKLGDAVERLESELINRPSPKTLSRIHHHKREILLLRKSVWPMREVLTSLTRDESKLVSRETRVYLRDTYDHTIHIIETLSTIRDLLGGMLELYLSTTSNRLNEVMIHLTIFASIFMPLTFLAGIYGMNFEYMPELAWPWAYFATLGLMASIAIGLFLYFRKKGWV